MAELRPDAIRRTDTLDHTPAAPSVPLARRRAARLVTGWGHPDLAGDVALVVSELMTNALLHGSVQDRLIRVRLYATDATLRVEVSDPRAERQPEVRGAPDDMDQFGRGLLLVGALADQWGWEPWSAGKTVWAQWGLDQDRARTCAGDGPTGTYRFRYTGDV
ncbi:ATP-binding protein [Streptomyces kunmingensis]|uniref:ATP-binding protein n=1 Tax=Streptomyces kunmingensis TaxID=68225 RepID=A0ABU6CCG7_9ACTN|nr:ATP-binding protein [Streptomyces kunmingensis]MEB3962407.1 ATP-binding protein [Streptomyces kunmingensis]